MGEAVPLDPADLPGYAVRLHDHVVEHPDRLRLLRWRQLEQVPPNAGAEDPFQAIVNGKVEQLRRAQQAGALDPQWDPWDVLVFVTQLATARADRADATPTGPEHEKLLAARREAISTAVERLFPRSTS